MKDFRQDETREASWRRPMAAEAPPSMAGVNEAATGERSLQILSGDPPQSEPVDLEAARIARVRRAQALNLQALQNRHSHSGRIAGASSFGRLGLAFTPFARPQPATSEWLERPAPLLYPRPPLSAGFQERAVYAERSFVDALVRRPRPPHPPERSI